MLTVGASRCAAVGIISKLMDMHTPLGIGVLAGDVPCNGRWGGLGSLFERYSTCYFRVSAEFSNCNGGGVSTTEVTFVE